MGIKLINYKDLQEEEEAKQTLLSVQKLYLESFPKEERRPWDEVLGLLAQEKAFSLQIIVQQEGKQQAFVGFLSQWNLSDEWLFVEHFALSSELRNQGLGAESLRLLQKLNASQTIILECEPPTNELTTRRLNFYARQGFHVLSTSYEQPSYYPSAEGELKQNIQLYLLGNRSLFPSQISPIIQRIYCRAYGKL